MFNHNHYVPVLKAKEGEFKALQHSHDATKNSMTPLLEIVDIPWDYEKSTNAKTIEKHLSNIGKKINDAWGKERRIFVDSDILDNSAQMSDNITHHLSFLFDDFRQIGLNTVPVTGLSRHIDYKTSVQQIIQQDKKGICLRLTSDDLSKTNLKQLIDADLALYGISAKEIDLVIDMKSINTNYSNTLLTLSVIINNVVPYVNDWRSLTVSASSFPMDLSAYPPTQIFHTINRSEWFMYNQLLSTVTRKPTFSDYAVSNPESLEMDPRFITVSASIRYTSDDYWLIARGRGTTKFGWAQYHDLSLNLIARPEYCGLQYSHGDAYIEDCASRTVGTGNSATWRTIGCNHHFQKVVTQVSNLP